LVIWRFSYLPNVVRKHGCKQHESDENVAN